MRITINVPDSKVKNGEDLARLLDTIAADHRCEKLETLLATNCVLDHSKPGTPIICTIGMELGPVGDHLDPG